MADDHRRMARDSLFLLADVRVAGREEPRRVRVRNLSALGMMAEGALDAARGTLVEVAIRNIEPVEGSVAWVQGDRCGIAFGRAIDPLAARAPIGRGEGTPRYVKPPLASHEPDERVRKV